MKNPQFQICVNYACLLVMMLTAMALLDVAAARIVHEHPLAVGVRTAFRITRLPGHFGFTVALAALLVWRRGINWRDALALLAVGAIASGVTAALKLVFGRIRPNHGVGAFDWTPFPYSFADSFAAKNLSFPSGDATLAFATAAMVAYFLPRWRWMAFAVGTLVAITRVAQGAHYPSDVIAGAIVGIAVTDVFVFIRGRFIRRNPEALPPPA